MPFPDLPKTGDERRSELLRLMGVTGHPGVYVLGCFAKYVTVYAQQVRALNLVDSLAKAGRLSRHSRLAVIGGGISGLTCAAAAAIRGVGHVQVFEKLDATLRLQRTSEKRFLHPFIYDWPQMPDLEEEKVVRANLPLMDWKADAASKVIEELDRRWHEILEGSDGSLKSPRCGCGTVELRSSHRGQLVCLEGTEPEQFDVVILAVGFGLDRNESTNGYWADTNIDAQEIEKGQSWFVSGYSDGALTDLMRLCIRDFNHGRILATVDDRTRKIVGIDLMDAERVGTIDQLAVAYRRAAEKIAPALDGKLPRRGFGKIRLNCSEGELFSPRGSILNRLIAAYLLNQNRFELIEGKIITPVSKKGAYYKLQFKNNPDTPIEPAEEVIIRHGPAKAIEADFPEIWTACQPVAAEWQEARQHEDWTRKPLYREGEFDPRGKKMPPLRVHFVDQIGCVVLTGSFIPDGLDQQQRVGSALGRFQTKSGEAKYAGRIVNTTPVWIRVEDALATSDAFERAVRALCETEIAVFDITGLEAAVMLFLGIRAAVRRGITITIKEHEESPLPFNIASLNPISLGQGDIQGIGTAIESGLAAIRGQPSTYLDLPVFDAIRNVGQDFRPKEPAKQILVLKWFDKQYSKLISDVLDNELKSRFGQNTSIVTTLDSRSPQLVEQRLYADIRRTKLCIADWTGWRPNVFFEIGVRLAVNEIDPLHILCTDRPPSWKNKNLSRWPKLHDPSAENLKNFFCPVEFSIPTISRLIERIKNLDANFPNRSTDQMLSAGRTYRVVLEALNARAEPGGRPVHEILKAAAEAMAGPSVPEEGGNRVLFSEALADQVRRAARESILAAWYYLSGRYCLIERIEEGRIREADIPLVKSLQLVGEDIRDRLRNAPPEYHTIYTEIIRILRLIDSNLEASHERRELRGRGDLRDREGPTP